MKSEKAVTMLILVLTIIIILIIAGVTLSYIIGEEGTVNRTSDASFRTELEQIYEQLREKEDLYALEGVKVNEDAQLTDIEKQDILSSHYNVYDEDKTTMDIEVIEVNGEAKLILMYKSSAFNDSQINILNEYGAKPMKN